MKSSSAAAPVIFDDKKIMEELQQRFTVAELMAIQPGDRVNPTPAQRERHELYLLLLMSLVFKYWNGNRKGPIGEYPYRVQQKTGGVYQDGKEYYGHNIAAIAVDGVGKVIDFDFNHNDLFRSSMEHAEARLLKRLFSLTGLRNDWELGDVSANERPRRTFSTLLKDVTVYTTLEPCAQCAGIMALAQVKEVVYLQVDDGTRRVANVLFNLKPYSFSVRPTTAQEYGFDLGTQLADAYDRYKEEIRGGKAFWIDPVTNHKDMSSSLASFLCTDAARYIFQLGHSRFQAYNQSSFLGVEASRRFVNDLGEERVEFSNDIVLREVKAFYDYAVSINHRGTPH